MRRLVEEGRRAGLWVVSRARTLQFVRTSLHTVGMAAGMRTIEWIESPMKTGMRRKMKMKDLSSTSANTNVQVNERCRAIKRYILTDGKY